MWGYLPTISTPFLSMNIQKSTISAKNIAIISGLEIIGDGLMKLPFLRAVRQAYPDAKIHWITTKGSTVYNGLLKETVKPLIDKIHEQPSWILNKEDSPYFDIVIDTRGRWKLSLQAKKYINHKIFISHAFGFIFSDIRPSIFSKKPKRMIDRLMQMLELCTGYKPKTTGRLPISKDLISKAKEIMPDGKIYIGFSVGAGNGIKKWPLEKFKLVAKEQVLKDRIPVFILGPQEIELHDELIKEIPEAIFPLQSYEILKTDKPKIEHTLAIGSCLNLAVTNDSGTSHMLAAVDCPLISLFGPTSAEKLAPKVTTAIVIKSQDYGSNNMKDIPTTAVINAIENIC